MTFGDTVFENTPLGNYDFFFQELEENYAYKDHIFDGRTLEEIKDDERPFLAAHPTWRNLNISLNMVVDRYIRDPHLYPMHVPEWDREKDELLREERGEEFDNYIPFDQGRDLPEIYPGLTMLGTASPLYYGIIEKEPPIGYIYVQDLVKYGEGGGRLSSARGLFGKLTDEILTAFHQRGAGSLIIDIRSYAGGAVQNGREIARRLFNEKTMFMNSYYPRAPLGQQSVDEYLSPGGVNYYRDKDLVVLVNSNTGSGGEMLFLMLQQAPGFLASLGTPTLGGSGTVIDRELPNGWVFRITSSRTTDKNGVDFFQRGIPPDTIQRANGEASVLEAAVDLLSSRF